MKTSVKIILLACAAGLFSNAHLSAEEGLEAKQGVLLQGSIHHYEGVRRTIRVKEDEIQQLPEADRSKAERKLAIAKQKCEAADKAHTEYAQSVIRKDPPEKRKVLADKDTQLSEDLRKFVDDTCYEISLMKGAKVKAEGLKRLAEQKAKAAEKRNNSSPNAADDGGLKSQTPVADDSGQPKPPGGIIILGGKAESWQKWPDFVHEVVRDANEKATMFSPPADRTNHVHTILRYTVTRDLKIENVNVVRTSGNKQFDADAVSAIKNMAGDKRLTFPELPADKMEVPGKLATIGFPDGADKTDPTGGGTIGKNADRPVKRKGK